MHKENYSLSYQDCMKLISYTYPQAETNDMGASASLATYDSFNKHGVIYPICKNTLFFCMNTAYQLGVIAGKKTERKRRKDSKC